MTGKSNFLRIISVLFLLVSFSLAQGNAPGSPASGSADAIKAYFFLIVMATVISQVVNYLKLLLQWIWPHVSWLVRSGDWLWRKAQKIIERVVVSYQEEEARVFFKQFLIFLATHSAGILIGVVLCMKLQFGVLDDLGFHFRNTIFNYLFSGIAAGLGIQPVHSLFKWASEKRRIKNLLSSISQ